MEKLAGVHPVLLERVGLILEVMARLGFPMMVTDGVRTPEEQQALYARGRTTRGPKVTNADGVQIRSPHQPQADGFGHAVDCAFVVRGKPSWDEAHPWRLYGEVARALGLLWGGDWRGLHDRPHVELE